MLQTELIKTENQQKQKVIIHIFKQPILISKYWVGHKKRWKGGGLIWPCQQKNCTLCFLQMITKKYYKKNNMWLEINYLETQPGTRA